MVEKFYRVEPGSEFDQKYWLWKLGSLQLVRALKNIEADNGFDPGTLAACLDSLYVKTGTLFPATFVPQLLSKVEPGGKYWRFRKNSVLGKEWTKICNEIRPSRRPSPSFYNNKFSGRSASSLFDFEGTVYCSVEAEEVEMPNTFIEIKASFFYTIVERMEQKGELYDHV